MVGKPKGDVVADFYNNYYQDIFNASGFVGWAYRSTHRQVERGVKTPNGSKILEIGAGTGEHLLYVYPNFSSYEMLDLSAAPNPWPWIDDSRIKWKVGDVCEDIAFEEKFNRIISMCVMHHVSDPARALQNIRKWLKPGGLFSLFLPSDPGLLNRINRRLFVKPRAQKLGFEGYDLMNAREHRNHYWALRTELLEAFQGCQIKSRYFPFGIPWGNFSTYSIWQIRVPESD